jgi:hypothetical protein
MRSSLKTNKLFSHGIRVDNLYLPPEEKVLGQSGKLADSAARFHISAVVLAAARAENHQQS